MEAPLLVLAIVLQVLDAATTIIAFRYPRARESNGMMATLIRRVGLVPAFVITKVVAIAILVAMWYFDVLLLPVLLLVCGVYVYVVWNNLRVIKRLKYLAAQDVPG